VIEGCNSTGQVLDLLSRYHQFESHKPQDHWRLTWSLISVSMKLVEMQTSYPYTYINNNNNNNKILKPFN
jgi:hypothetical protein